MKLASPRLNVLILVGLSFAHIGPLLFALVLSANDYNIDMPLSMLCWVCVCVSLVAFFFYENRKEGLLPCIAFVV